MGQTVRQRQLKVLEGVDRVEREKHAEGHHSDAIHPACPLCRKLEEQAMKPPPESTLYRDLVDAGADMDHYESTLYVVVTPEITAIIARYKDIAKLITFNSNIDGKLNYDVPFCYEPFWEAKQRRDAR